MQIPVNKIKKQICVHENKVTLIKGIPSGKYAFLFQAPVKDIFCA
jgi:hypothetical protein